MKKSVLVAIACVAALIAGVVIFATGDGDASRKASIGSNGKNTPPAGEPQSDTSAPDRAVKAPTQSEKAERALAKLQARVAKQAEKDGFKNSWAISLQPNGKLKIETNADKSKVDNVMRTATADPDEGGEIAKSDVVLNSTIQDNWHRRDDIPAFWGGSGISQNGGLCSNGYAARKGNGEIVGVSAGHCFGLGSTVYNESGNQVFGTVQVRNLPTVNSQPVDYELIGGKSYAPYVYTGGVTSTTSQPVKGAGGAVQGFSDYCHSGRTTGQSCGHTAVSTNAQVCTSSGCKSPVIEFSGGQMIQGGDSGGTFYAKGGDGTGVFVRGNTIASRNDGSAGWAMPWTVIAQREGLTIVTAS